MGKREEVFLNLKERMCRHLSLDFKTDRIMEGSRKTNGYEPRVVWVKVNDSVEKKQYSFRLSLQSSI